MLNVAKWLHAMMECETWWLIKSGTDYYILIVTNSLLARLFEQINLFIRTYYISSQSHILEEELLFTMKTIFIYAGVCCHMQICLRRWVLLL